MAWERETEADASDLDTAGLSCAYRKPENFQLKALEMLSEIVASPALSRIAVQPEDVSTCTQHKNKEKKRDSDVTQQCRFNLPQAGQSRVALDSERLP